MYIGIIGLKCIDANTVKCAHASYNYYIIIKIVNIKLHTVRACTCIYIDTWIVVIQYLYNALEVSQSLL